MTSPTVKLNSGHEMPLVGFGLWKVENNTADTVYNAIKAGYRLFDGACGTFQNKEKRERQRSQRHQRQTRAQLQQRADVAFSERAQGLESGRIAGLGS